MCYNPRHINFRCMIAFPVCDEIYTLHAALQTKCHCFVYENMTFPCQNPRYTNFLIISIYFQWVASHVLTLIRLKYHCRIPGCNIQLMISSISYAIILLPKGYGTQARVSVRFLRRKWATRKKLCEMVPKLHNHAYIRPQHYSPQNTYFLCDVLLSWYCFINI